MDNSAQASPRDGNVIVIERVFSAPRELVFEAWTRAEHIEKWYGPKGFTVTVVIEDVVIHRGRGRC